MQNRNDLRLLSSTCFLEIDTTRMDRPHNTEVVTRTSQGQQPTFQSIDQVIQQLYMPALRSRGTKVARIIDLPGIANNDARIYQQFWKYAPTQDYHTSKGIEITQASTGYKGIITKSVHPYPDSYRQRFIPKALLFQKDTRN